MLPGFFCPLKKKNHETAKIVAEESRYSQDYGTDTFEVSLSLSHCRVLPVGSIHKLEITWQTESRFAHPTAYPLTSVPPLLRYTYFIPLD